VNGGVVRSEIVSDEPLIGLLGVDAGRASE
jgi:hypothetical protein